MIEKKYPHGLPEKRETNYISLGGGGMEKNYPQRKNAFTKKNVSCFFSLYYSLIVLYQYFTQYRCAVFIVFYPYVTFFSESVRRVCCLWQPVFYTYRLLHVSHLRDNKT